ncbi:cytochrome c nitrite reductase pentaheme subunit [bacterium BMS3Abin09]|nr:cytochrome c nitrite reductase pentaheme subunit [bacterium BMS3Abin09]
MKKIFYLILFMTTLTLQLDTVYAVEAPRNPNSAKECAICHYRWIDIFFVDGKGSELVPYQAEKVVAKPEICFSCHDGSVVDSRAKVYNDHRHKINRPPPEYMKIPKIYPLDKEGNMQCATCHTAHGVSSEMGIEKTIFVRSSNKNSAMCRSCHSDKDGGTAFGNHPIGSTKMKIPDGLIKRGAILGDGENNIICETCHVVHGSPNESFLIESSRNSQLCLECHSDKNIFTQDGKRNHFHVINAIPGKVKIPEDLIKKGSKLGRKGEIICQTCHKIHNNRIEKDLLLIKKGKGESLCLTCHTDKQYLANTKHNLNHSAPNEKNLDGKTVAEAGICSPCHLPHKEARKPGEGNDFTTRLCLSCHSKGNIAEKALIKNYKHPVDVNPFDIADTEVLLKAIGVKKKDLKLPLFSRAGAQDRNGLVTCATCHDPHRWRSDSTEGEIREDVKGDHKTSFLRRPSPALCRECHSNKFAIVNSKHDMRKTAPEEKNFLGQLPSESGLCGTCHIIHGGQKNYIWGRDIKSKSGQVVQNLCVSCHNKDGIANKKLIKEYSHPMDISPSEKGLSTTLPLFDKNGKVSRNGLIACQTCHDPHRWDPTKVIKEEHFKEEGTAQNSFLRLKNSPSPALCTNCHTEQAYVEKTDHDLNITAPEYKNNIGETPAESGACGVCHQVHNSRFKFKLWAQGFGNGKKLMNMMCNYCHSKDGIAKNKIPKIYTHPDGMLITNEGKDIKGKPDYFPIYNKVGALTTVGNISCPSCHDVHQWNPRFFRIGDGVNVEGTSENSFLRAQTYNLLCTDCHGLDALFRFKFYHDPEERVEKRSGPFIPINLKEKLLEQD